MPIRIEDMTHSHRLSLLGFLRKRAGRAKWRADLRLASMPEPGGDMACDAFDAVCDEQWNTPAEEWIEDQPLIKALVYWTTPWGDSPLTWRPMNEAPRGIPSTPIMVRYRDRDGAEHTAIVIDSPQYAWVCFPSYEPLMVPDGHGGEDYADPTEWRALRDEEAPAFQSAPVPSACGDSDCDEVGDCRACGGKYHLCPHAKFGTSDYCPDCEET